MSEKKLSRDATPEEIFPEGHRPVSGNAAALMRAAMDTLVQGFPGYHVTLFVAEKEPSQGRPLPMFNYASTAARPDMVAILRAFVVKQEAEGPKLDKLDGAPPTDRRQ